MWIPFWELINDNVIGYKKFKTKFVTTFFFILSPYNFVQVELAVRYIFIFDNAFFIPSHVIFMHLLLYQLQTF
jgi:hypothetical protein